MDHCASTQQKKPSPAIRIFMAALPLQREQCALITPTSKRIPQLQFRTLALLRHPAREGTGQQRTSRRRLFCIFNLKRNPRTNVRFSPSKAKSRRLCVGFERRRRRSQQAGRDAPLRSRYAGTQTRTHAGPHASPATLCHMHEALVHVQAQKQALLREEHRIGMERSRGVGRAPLLIARVFDRQSTILRRGNATAQQEEHTR